MGLLDDLKQLRTEATAAFAEAKDAQTLEATRIAFLGKKGKLKGSLGRMSEVPKEERPKVGQMAKEVETAIRAAFG